MDDNYCPVCKSAPLITDYCPNCSRLGNSSGIMEDEIESLRKRVAELEKERDELVAALKQFAECDLNDDNCASLEVATRRIRSLAQAALAKLGAGETAHNWVPLKRRVMHGD